MFFFSYPIFNFQGKFFVGWLALSLGRSSVSMLLLLIVFFSNAKQNLKIANASNGPFTSAKNIPRQSCVPCPHSRGYGSGGLVFRVFHQVVVLPGSCVERVLVDVHTFSCAVGCVRHQTGRPLIVPSDLVGCCICR